MKTLLIGNKGFIGSHLQRGMLREGISFIGCDILPQLRKEDVTVENSAHVTDLIREGNFDLVINASGSPGVGFSLLYTEKDKELNFSNVCLWSDSIVKNSPQTRFINFSSAAVYGNPQVLPISENAPVHPVSPYGQHKKMAEEYLMHLRQANGIRYVSLRVFSAYGPGLYKQLFWDIYQKYLLGSTIELSGTGKESRDFIFIDDLVKAVLCIIKESDFGGECINIASGRESTICEAAEKFVSFLPRKSKIVFNGLQKTGDPVNWRADIEKLKSLGFTDAISVTDGLHFTAMDYLKHTS